MKAWWVADADVDYFHSEGKFFFQPLLMTTLAPSLPRMPRSCGFGLWPLPRFLLRNPSIPECFTVASTNLASAGRVESFFASSGQLPSTVAGPALDIDFFREALGRGFRVPD